MTSSLTFALEWSGCAFSILGAYLVARNDGLSRYGFVSFLFANALWFAYAVMTQAHGLALQQIAFTATSVYGIWSWFGSTPRTKAAEETTCDRSC